MSKTPQFDTKIKEILDALEPGERVCALTGEKWVMDEEEITWYKKFNVPPHSWSPLTRMNQLVSFFTMYQFWYQKHPETGEQFVTLVHPMTQIQAVPDEEWIVADYTEINQEPQLDQSIFKQLRELQKKVPHPATKYIEKPVNSISLASFGDVNSYFVKACRSKNSLFGSNVMDMEGSCEASGGTSIQNSYHTVQSHRIFNCKFVHGSYDCIDSAFLFDCRNCKNCFGATNKRNRQYVWFNEQLSKEEYEQRIKEVDLSCRSSLRSHLDKFYELMINNTVWPENFNEKCANVIGEYVHNATDCKFIYSGAGGPFRDCYYVDYLNGLAESNAFSGGAFSSSNCYLTNTAVQSNNILFSHFAVESQNLEYCIFCYNCEDCFGCVCLQRKRFCIFNKQYGEEEYWKKLDEIKCAMLESGEYGQFLPAEFSTSYFFNSGSASLYLADQEDAKRFEVLDYGPEDGGATGIDQSASQKALDSKQVPECINDVDSDKWSQTLLHDLVSNRHFRLLKPELEFYKKHHLAAPTEHFVKRMLDLTLEQNTAIFEEVACDQCQTKIVVAKNNTYPNRKIYCRDCYLKYLEQYG